MQSPEAVHIRVAVGAPGSGLSSPVEQHHAGQLWKIETDSPDSGGVSAYGSTVRFKHILTGRYLCTAGTAMTSKEQRQSLSVLHLARRNAAAESGRDVSPDGDVALRKLEEGISAGHIYKLTTVESPSQLSDFSFERTAQLTRKASDAAHVHLSDYVFLKSARSGWVHTPDTTQLEETERLDEWQKLVGTKFFDSATATKRGERLRASLLCSVLALMAGGCCCRDCACRSCLF